MNLEYIQFPYYFLFLAPAFCSLVKAPRAATSALPRTFDCAISPFTILFAPEAISSLLVDNEERVVLALSCSSIERGSGQVKTRCRGRIDVVFLRVVRSIASEACVDELALVEGYFCGCHIDL